MTGRAHLAVHVAALEALTAAAGELPPVIERLYRRARSHTASGDCAWAGALDLPRNLGAAPLSRLAGPDAEAAAGGCWMRADPVVLTPDLTAVWVRGPARFPAPGGLRDRLIGELERLFADEGFEFRPGGGAVGHLRVDRMPDCRFLQPEEIRGRRLDEVLPVGAEARRWRRLINAAQMIFHQFRQPGAPDSAGLWFWGAGILPDSPGPRPGLEVAPAGDPVLAGLARWLDAAVVDADSFSVPDATRLVCWWPDHAATAEVNLQVLAGRWLEPAWSALKRGRLHRLSVTGIHRVLDASRRDAWAFWRRGPGDR